MEFLSMEYYKNFKCIGNECEDHCCKAWTITIDKKTFKNYKNLNKTNFSKKLNSSIKRNRNMASIHNYGKFELVGGLCPMLSEDRLCEVYLNIGEENMCNTCKTYPRIYNKVNGRIEASLTLSCIEAARNILLNKECIEFNLENKKVHDIRFNRMVEENNMSTCIIKNFDEIRCFCIGLIQERRYSIEERLIILGLFIKNLEELEDTSLVLNLIYDYKNRINNGLYDEILDNFKMEEMLRCQNEFCTGIYNVILSKKISDKRFLNKFEIFYKFLHLDKNEITSRVEILKNSLQNEYEDFVKEYQYIYENYLISYMFENLFPVNDTSINNAYNNLVIRFSLIKMTLIGLSGYYKNEMKVDYAIEFIQSFSKIIEHDSSIMGKLNNYLKDNNMNTLAYMMIMIGK